jgi:hypothetical protein
LLILGAHEVCSGELFLGATPPEHLKQEVFGMVLEEHQIVP